MKNSPKTINNETSSINENYFQRAIDFLNEYKWIYDFQVTELFCDQNLFLNKFPKEWQDFLSKLDHNALNNFVLQNENFKTPTPVETLNDFLNERNYILSVSSPVEFWKRATNANSCWAINGLTAKKSYEIQTLIPFVKDLCVKHDCNYLIDIGSGLNYFDELLVQNCANLTVIGCERNEQLVNEANQRLKSKNVQNVLNICQELNENNLFEFLAQVKQKIAEDQSSTTNTRTKKNIGLFSLHSCGDLTPTMLKLFEHNKKQDLKFMCAFSCCYHKMTNMKETSFKYKNFPMSNKLKELKFEMSQFGMRLACQQNVSAWSNRSASEHDEHSKQVAYRALIQKYCQLNDDLKLVKLKRKLAGKQNFFNFEKYLDCLSERCYFESAKRGQRIEIKDCYDSLLKLHENHSNYFDKIEPLTALQSLMQPILERLILKDRQMYLNEKQIYDTKLVGLFDDAKSSRSICILSE